MEIFIFLVVVSAGIIGYAMMTSKEGQSYDGFVSEVRLAFLQDVAGHESALVRKRNQMLKIDEYGDVDHKRWGDEIEYFFNRTLSQRFSAELSKYQINYNSRNAAYIQLLAAVNPFVLIEDRLVDAINKKYAAGDGDVHRQNMSGEEYEHDVARRLIAIGYTAYVTPASGDQGIDVVAEKDGISFGIQCKRYSKPVGNNAVQQANAGAVFHSTDFAAVVSTSGFTDSARDLARHVNVLLIEDFELEHLFESFGAEDEAAL